MKEHPNKSASKSNSSKIDEKVLILIDDDSNTFDYVVDCLMSLCDHKPIQAEQCALLTHYKGSCEILTGKFADLKLVEKDLSLYGLNVDIL